MKENGGEGFGGLILPCQGQMGCLLDEDGVRRLMTPRSLSNASENQILRYQRHREQQIDVMRGRGIVTSMTFKQSGRD